MTRKYVSLEEAKELSSELSGIPVNFLHRFNELPTLDITSLQRYEHTDLNADMLKDDTGEYVKYSDLADLLRN